MATGPIFSETATETLLQDSEKLAPAQEDVEADQEADQEAPGDTDSAPHDALEDTAPDDVGDGAGPSDGGDDIVGGGEASANAPSASAASNGKRYYNIIAVIGASMPSNAACYAGSSPKVAVRKAGRRIWKKTQVTNFTIIMRRVSQVVVGRELYKYDVSVIKQAEPNAFFTATAPTFVTASGAEQTDVDKQVRIVRKSSDPVLGYISDDGKILEGVADGRQPVHRVPGTNTLNLVIGSDPYPTEVGGRKVIRSDHTIEAKRVKAEEEEVQQYDVAGSAKQAAKDSQRAAKEKIKEKAAKAKAKAKEAEALKKQKAKEKAAKAKAKLKAKSSKTGGADEPERAPKTKSHLINTPDEGSPSAPLQFTLGA
jgi:hypothetical protein